MTCGTCGRPPGETSHEEAHGGFCMIKGDVDCWRARAERLEAERDEAVALLRRCDLALFDHVDRQGVRFAVDDFLTRVDAKGKP